MLKILNHVYRNFLLITMPQIHNAKGTTCFKSISNPLRIDLSFSSLLSNSHNNVCRTLRLPLNGTYSNENEISEKTPQRLSITDNIKNLIKKNLGKS